MDQIVSVRPARRSTYVMDLTSHPLVYYTPDVGRPVLGPILFVLHTLDFTSLIKSHGFLAHVRGSHAGVRLMPAC